MIWLMFVFSKINAAATSNDVCKWSTQLQNCMVASTERTVTLTVHAWRLWILATWWDSTSSLVAEPCPDWFGVLAGSRGVEEPNHWCCYFGGSITCVAQNRAFDGLNDPASSEVKSAHKVCLHGCTPSRSQMPTPSTWYNLDHLNNFYKDVLF